MVAQRGYKSLELYEISRLLNLMHHGDAGKPHWNF